MNEKSDVYEDIKKELLPYENWERLAGESGAAYAAFCVYRDYGPERNIRKAAVRYADSLEFDGISDSGTEQRHGSKPSNSRQTVERRYRMWRLWSTQFRCVKRAEDYDLYLDRLKQTELRKTIEARGEAHREVTGKMLQVVNKKLDMMNPADLPQGTVTEWVETAVKTEREIFGLTTGKERTEAGKPGNITFTPEFEGL
jgi:hypothetical protein